METKSFHDECYLTVTPTGAVELARLGLLDPVSQGMIDDKPKADPITKVLICMQAGWSIVQSIARVAQGLPLSLLEIHVLAHVLVALLMYLFWFAKPYNPLSPVVLTETRVVQAAALFTLHKIPIEDPTRKADHEKSKEALKCVLIDELKPAKTSKDPSFSCAVNNGLPIEVPKSSSASEEQSVCDSHLKSADEQLTTDPLPSRIAKDDSAIETLTMPPPKSYTMLEDSKTLLNSHQRKSIATEDELSPRLPPRTFIPTVATPRGKSRAVTQTSTPKTSIDGPESKSHRTTDINVPIDIKDPHVSTTFTLAQFATRRLRSNNLHFPYYVHRGHAIEQRPTFLTPDLDDLGRHLDYELFSPTFVTTLRRRLDRIFDALLPSKDWGGWLTLLISSYDPFHLTAWNSHFPTSIERTIWHASGLAIVLFPILGIPFIRALAGLSSVMRKLLMDKRLWMMVVCSPLHVLDYILSNGILPSFLVISYSGCISS